MFNWRSPGARREGARAHHRSQQGYLTEAAHWNVPHAQIGWSVHSPSHYPNISRVKVTRVNMPDLPVNQVMRCWLCSMTTFTREDNRGFGDNWNSIQWSNVQRMCCVYKIVITLYLICETDYQMLSQAVESPVFRDTGNKTKIRNSGRKLKNISKYRKYSYKA